MSTVLYTLAPTATRIRYREPYLSDALNKKYQSIVPFGIYEGFTPAPSVVAQSLDLQPGSIGHAAVVESDLDNTVQVSVHLDGTLTLDLSAQAGQTVVVLLEATYAYPQETTAYIKMYLEGDPAIPASACTICKVAVPSLAVVLTDADISLTGRTFPWDTRDRNAVPMLALAKNAGFEFVSESTPTIGVAPPYWNLTTGGLGQFQMSNLPGPSGTGGYVIGYSVAAGSAHTNIFYQRYSVPVSSANNRIRFGVRFQPIIQTALNNPVLTVTLINPVTGVIIQTLSIVLDSSAPFLGSWTQYEETLEAYSIGADGACVAQLTLAFNNVQYGTLGEAFYATDFVLEVEADSKAADVGGQLGGDTRFNTLTLTDANYATNKGVVLSHSASTDVMSLAAVPGVTGTPGLYVPGTLTIGGGVVFGGDLTVTGDLYVNGGDIQRSTAGTLNVGTDAANVTTLTLGSTATTTLQGNTLNIGTNASNTAINIGTAAPSTTRTLTLGVNSSTLTSSLLGGTITVGFGATSTIGIGSTIANSATITLGSSTATLTTTTINGVTVSVGGSNTSTLNLGNSSTSSATIRLGNAPTGGSVATTVQGNTVSVGVDADTTAVNVGTTTTSSAAITLGNAPAAGTVATGIAGNDISIGTSANTNTITIGDGVSGTLRIARYLDGNTGTLSLGTDTTRSTAVEVGNTSANLTLAGAAITLGTAAATTSITIGDGASGTLRVAQYLDGNTGELSLGTNNSYTTTLVTLGNNSTPLTMAGTAINLGTNAASGTMTLSRSGQTTAIAGNATVAGTSTLTGVVNADGGIGRSTAGTLTVGNDADVTAIQIGTASSTGGVSVSQAGQTTTVNGALAITQATTATGVINANGGVDRSTATALAIGATNATDVNIGRATQNVAIQNTMSIAGATTATGAINANGGVERSTSGTLTIGSTTSTTGINIGTTNTTGGVTISRSGQNTVVQGNLGVGVTPSYLADIRGTNSPILSLTQTSAATVAQYPLIQNFAYSGALGGHPAITQTNSRGTSASPAPLIAGDMLGTEIFYGNVATAGSLTVAEGGRIEVSATAVPSTSTITSKMVFKTTNAAASSAARMEISGPGNVTINAPVSGDALSVAGTTKVTSGSLYVQNGFWGSALGHDISLSTGSTGSVIQLRPNGSGSADYAYVASAASGKHQFYRGSGAIGVEFDNYPSIHIGAPPSTDTRIAVLAYRSAASTDCWFQAANGSTGSGGGNGFVFGLNTSNEAILKMYETAAMRFYTDNTERMSIGSAGNLSLVAGNSIVFPPSGSSGSSTSTALGTYDEGTWTPQLVAMQGAIPRPIGLTIHTGTYVRVGKIVTLFMDVTTITAPAGPGPVFVSGFPFTNSLSGNVYSATMGGFSNFGTNIKGPLIISSSNYLHYISSAGGSMTSVFNSDFNYTAGNQTRFSLTIVYGC